MDTNNKNEKLNQRQQEQLEQKQQEQKSSGLWQPGNGWEAATNIDRLGPKVRTAMTAGQAFRLQ